MIKTKLGDARVFHFRDYDFDGNLENGGGATYVFVKVPDKGWIYATAYCNNKDNFCRKIGREIAKGRLEKGHWSRWTGRVDPTWETVQSTYELQSLSALVRDMPHSEVYDHV